MKVLALALIFAMLSSAATRPVREHRVDPCQITPSTNPLPPDRPRPYSGRRIPRYA